MNELPKLDTKTTKESIIKFIQDKVSEANAKGLVVGLSGGIDSTLTAYLATEAVGKENVFGIVCHLQPPQQKIKFMEQTLLKY